MIYLIGGSPRSGKTTVAKKLSQELSIHYISTDYLRLVVMPYFKGESKKYSFPYETLFDMYGDVESFFENTKGDDILNADLKEAEILWTGIKSFINFLSLTGTDYILEGIHLLPNLVHILRDNKDFRILILTKTDAKSIYKGLLKNKGNSDWIADNIKDENTLFKSARSLSDYGKYFIAEGEKYGLKVINTEESFDEKIKIGLDYLKS